MIHIVSWSYRNAELYRGLAGLSPQQARIITTPESIRAMNGARVIVLGLPGDYERHRWDRYHEALEAVRAVVQYDDTDRLLGVKW